MNMEQKVFADEKQIIKFSNSGLLIQNEKPLKIYLEGFPISEFVELMKIVKDHGGEVSSRVEAGVIILSRPDCSSETQSSRFDVKWLYDCVKSSRILNPSKYQLEVSNTNIKHEAEVKDYRPLKPMNVRLLQENNATNCNTPSKAIIKISKISPFSQINASPDIINENLIPEDESEKPRTPKRRRSSQQAIYSSCKSLQENKSSKRQRYTDEEDRAMIQYLYDNDAIEIAGGTLIWHQMRGDGMMQHHSEKSLASHFSQCVRYRVQDLISDKEVVRQFQLRTVGLKRPTKKRRGSD